MFFYSGLLLLFKGQINKEKEKLAQSQRTVSSLIVNDSFRRINILLGKSGNWVFQRFAPKNRYRVLGNSQNLSEHPFPFWGLVVGK